MANDAGTAVVVAEHAVKIDDETYSLTQIPPAESRLVKAACADVTGNLNLDKLITDLELCKQLIYLARNGVQGAGTAETAEIVPNITKLHLDFTKVCGRADIELSAIAQCSVQIQSELLNIYDDLCEGDFTSAFKSMERFSSTAQQLADKAHKLAKEFGELESAASDILGQTQLALGKSEQAYKTLEARIGELKLQTDKAKSLAKSLHAAQQKLEADYQEAKDKAQDAETKAFSMAIVGAIFKPLAAGIGAGVAMYAGGAAGAAANSLRNKVSPTLPEDGTKTAADQAARATQQALSEAQDAEKKAVDALETASTRLADEEKKEKALTEKVTKLEKADKGTPTNGKADKLATGKDVDKDADKDKAKDPDKASGKATGKSTGKETGKAGAADDDKDAASDDADDDDQLEVAKADLKAVKEKVVTAKEACQTKDADLTAAREVLKLKLAAVNQAVQAAGEAGDKFTKMGDDYQEIATSYRKEVSAMRKLLADQALQENEALSNIKDYAARMKNAGPDLKGIELACDSLFQAVGALKQIVMILQEAGYFWEKMAAACLKLKDSSFTTSIQRLEDMKPERRASQLQRNGFQESMLRYYAGWKALEIVCLRFAAKATEVRQASAAEYKINLSNEQARLEARKLGETLLASVTAGLKASDATLLALQSADDELADDAAAAKPTPVAVPG